MEHIYETYSDIVGGLTGVPGGDEMILTYAEEKEKVLAILSNKKYRMKKINKISELDDVTFLSPIDAIDHAIKLLAYCMDNNLCKSKYDSRIRYMLRKDIPYCLHHSMINREQLHYCILNREYKPVGCHNEWIDKVDYSLYPNLSISSEYVRLIHNLDCREWNRKPGRPMVYLYDDGNSPWTSCKHAENLLLKLAEIKITWELVEENK